MIRVFAVILSVMFLLAVLGCGGNTANEKPSGINLNPDNRSGSTPPPPPPPKKPKAEPSPEMKWLGETFGKYFDEEGMKSLLASFPTMTPEDFEATLRGLEKDGETPAEEDILKAVEYFKAWKEQEAQKAAASEGMPAEETSTEEMPEEETPVEEGSGGM